MPVSALPSMKYLPPLDSEYAVSEEQVARFWQDGFIVDQYYWPVATDRAVGLWTPLVDCTEEMGAMRFVVGSHRRCARRWS